MTDEETRAAAYRATLARRKANDRARAKALAGSPTAARQVREDWQAVRDFTRDGGIRREPQE